ncbi:MAG: universal stress protein [Bacteroidota bacterium]
MLALKRILVPIDFSPTSERALRHARELAATYSAELILLHVIEAPSMPSIYGVAYAEAYGHVPDVEQRVQVALQHLMRDVHWGDLKRGVSYHVRQGQAANEITDYAAEHDVDLIVMGAQGLSRFERMLMGSVAKRVLARAPCPVLIIRKAGKDMVPPSEPIRGQVATPDIA